MISDFGIKKRGNATFFCVLHTMGRGLRRLPVLFHPYGASACPKSVGLT